MHDDDAAAGPRLWPTEPKLVNPSEREVWQRLREQLPADATLLSNLRLSAPEKNHEIDLVVLWPGLGVVVLEVKGNGIAYSDEQGWTSMRGGKQQETHPVDQVRRAMYALRAFVERDPRWSRQRFRWAHGLVTPYTTFGSGFELMDLPRWMLHDREDQPDLAGRLAAQLRITEHDDSRPPSAEDLDVVVQILSRRRPLQPSDVLDESDERAAAADQLTMEQAVLLGATRMLRRVEVRGGAGSGKTVLALQQAKELSRGAGERSPERVALLCYSIGLAAYLKREVATWPRRHRPAFVGTFHEFGRQWGAGTGSRQDSAFWEQELPTQMAGLAQGLEHGQRYDSIIVDEAQDFADTWWTPVLAALRDEQSGGLYVYSDENQRLFARYGEPPVPLVPLVLDHNLRNTKQILDAFSPLAPSRMRPRGSEGPTVRFVASTVEDALDAADEVVEELVETWPQQHVCLLTTGSRHPVQVERADGDDQEAYWQTFWDTDDVFYGHVLGCKGLERRVVVLCVNDDGTRERARERLYVGMSRATDVLVVVGDPEVIRRVGGQDVARKLGIA